MLKLADEFKSDIVLPCDVASDEDISKLFVALGARWDGLDGIIHSRITPRPRRVYPMFFQTEAKPQGWRAVAVFDDRTDRLIYLGRSSTQVRAGIAEASFEVVADEERNHVKSVSLTPWDGTPQ